jgi:ATP-binding cassette subfamily B (MDR/TAP) protein 1
LREDFLKQTLCQNIAFFNFNLGSISVQVTTNGNAVNTGIAEPLSITVQALTTFIAAFTIAFAVQ